MARFEGEPQLPKLKKSPLEDKVMGDLSREEKYEMGAKYRLDGNEYFKVTFRCEQMYLKGLSGCIFPLFFRLVALKLR